MPHEHHAPRGAHGASGRLAAALAITLLVALMEAAVGVWSGSLALIADAGHMVTDAVALGLAAVAAGVARRPPSRRHSFGLQRAETLAGLFNAGFMLALVIGIAWQALQRLLHPQPVAGEGVMAAAAVGLAANLFVAYLLARGEQDMNVRGALLHVMADVLGSIAALASGAVILLTGWTPIDPLLSLFVCGLIVWSAQRLLREAVHTLLEGVPPHLSLEAIGRRLAAEPGVVSVHDLHVWAVSSRMTALAAHVVVRDLDAWPDVLGRLRRVLHDEFDIAHVTLQPEAAAAGVAVVRWKA